MDAARRRRAESEPALFARFRRAPREADARGVLVSLTRWLDRALPSGGAATLHDLVVASGDPELAREVTALESALFGARPHGQEWSPARLQRCVARARGRLLERSGGASGSANQLPDLNP